MKLSISIVSLLSLMALEARAFAPSVGIHRSAAVVLHASPSSMLDNTPQYMDVSDSTSEQPQPTPQKKTPSKKASKHQGGIFSPLVVAFKILFGEEKLNKIRAKAISLHSDVIGNFVDTSDTIVGNFALRKLFEVADTNGDGTIDEFELKKLFQKLDFDWLQDKQIKGILQRADIDENGVIDFLEWKNEAPKTLRTNLIKLAKRNGGNLGFLV